MPRQWKLIALYMVVVFLIFVISIHIAKREVMEDEQRGTSAAAPPVMK